VDEELLRAAARRIGTAASARCSRTSASSRHPQHLCSYLNKLLWILTGNFAKKVASTCTRRSRHCSAPCPVVPGHRSSHHLRADPEQRVPEEILTDHPDRFRAMIVESTIPPTPWRIRPLPGGLSSAGIDGGRRPSPMTETARLAHYVLPAASQFEKPEATFFNFEFPHNGFHLPPPAVLSRCPVTLPEPEIWARLVAGTRRGRRRGTAAATATAAQRGRHAYARAFFTAIAANPTLAKVVPYVLYDTLGPTLPDGLAGRAALWGLAQKTALTYPDAVRRAGHADGDALFDAILNGPSGVTSPRTTTTMTSHWSVILITRSLWKSPKCWRDLSRTRRRP